MRKHKVAIIGYGGMGSWHAENISRRIPEIEISGVYDIRVSAKDKAASNGLRVYDSMESLLSDETVDIVTIATPNDSHAMISIQALKAGKNVICEKPVTLNTNELKEILKAGAAAGSVFSVHQNRRWDKDFCIVKWAQTNEYLGKVYIIESKVQGSRRAMHGWRGHKKNGGGMLYDWGVHLIDQMLLLVNSPVIEVNAHLLSIFSPEVDDNIRVALRFENGCSALLEMSTNCLINSPRWHVQGTEGTLQINDWSCKGTLRQLTQDAEMAWEDEIVYTEAGPTRTMAPRPSYTMNDIPFPEIDSDWSEYYRNYIDAMEGKAELIVKPHEILRVMSVIDLAFKAERDSQSQKCYI